jgi:hypothetical protein
MMFTYRKAPCEKTVFLHAIVRRRPDAYDYPHLDKERAGNLSAPKPGNDAAPRAITPRAVSRYAAPI